MNQEKNDVSITDEKSEIDTPLTPEKLEGIQGLLSQLPEEMLVEAISKSSPSGISLVRQTISQGYSGPLPPPKMLNDYELVTPGFAERIVTMAEKEQNHRHSLENTAVNGAITKDKRSQRYALFCIIFLSLLCGLLIYLGHEIAGTVFGGVTLVSIAALFITGKKDNKKNNIEEEQGENTDQ